MTVGRAAAEVGFFQFGRFAGSYRQAFGELPSATLRAARRRKA
jgi:transcriptional regulator GlxA family with amidase domain